MPHYLLDDPQCIRTFPKVPPNETVWVSWSISQMQVSLMSHCEAQLDGSYQNSAEAGLALQMSLLVTWQYFIGRQGGCRTLPLLAYVKKA